MVDLCLEESSFSVSIPFSATFKNKQVEGVICLNSQSVGGMRVSLDIDIDLDSEDELSEKEIEQIHEALYSRIDELAEIFSEALNT
jgi:hypothetical protein